jgi:hypothetical protein
MTSAAVPQDDSTRILRRVHTRFRRQQRDWPVRVERMVRAAESAPAA